MKTYSGYLQSIFPGIKVQKISIDAGFTCPNRDGTISTGGCLYCRNDSFTPHYCSPEDSVITQLEKGKKFFSRKYPEMKFLAYFQSYTGTYKKPIDEIKKLYEEALSVEGVIGIVVGTRPDSIPKELLDFLKDLNHNFPVFLELGAETSFNKTLRLINRNHTWEDVEKATDEISERGLHCGLHLIVGLPGETQEMILETIDKAIKLPIETLKIHQLQVLYGTPLLQKIESGEINVPDYTFEEYLELCVKIASRVPENIVIERFLSQSPPGLVKSPSWGLKNYEFMNKLKLKLESPIHD